MDDFIDELTGRDNWTRWRTRQRNDCNIKSSNPASEDRKIVHLVRPSRPSVFKFQGLAIGNCLWIKTAWKNAGRPQGPRFGSEFAGAQTGAGGPLWRRFGDLRAGWRLSHSINSHKIQLVVKIEKNLTFGLISF